MLLTNWVKRLQKSSAPITLAKKPSRRWAPRLEPLEAREVPALFIVNTLADSGVGSLRDAVVQANTVAGADVIEFQSGLSGGITLESGELQVTDSLSITGPAGGITISGNNASRIVNVDDTSAAFIEVAIVGLTLTGGNANSSGGAIRNTENLTLTDCTLSGNTAGEVAGGIFNEGTATLTNCILSGNSTGVNGGGIFSIGTATLTNCTLSGNSAGFGAGIFSFFTAALTGCTFSGNSAFLGGGMMNNGTATFTNCTLADNTAQLGGGIYNNGTCTVTLTGCTLSGNLATEAGDHGGGGLYNSGTATLNNTIVANSLSGGDVFNKPIGGGSFGTIMGGHNLVEDGSDGLADTIIADPMLGPLADNGGPTLTHALLAGSPALNAGSDALVPLGVNVDQRGASRFVGTVDIGAFEFQGAVNNAPTNLTLSHQTIQENLPVGAAVGTFITTDPDGGDTHTYALVSGAGDSGNAAFQIVGNQLRTSESFDFERHSNAKFRVRKFVTDAVDYGDGVRNFLRDTVDYGDIVRPFRIPVVPQSVARSLLNATVDYGDRIPDLLRATIDYGDVIRNLLASTVDYGDGIPNLLRATVDYGDVIRNLLADTVDYGDVVSAFLNGAQSSFNYAAESAYTVHLRDFLAATVDYGDIIRDLLNSTIDYGDGIRDFLAATVDYGDIIRNSLNATVDYGDGMRNFLSATVNPGSGFGGFDPGDSTLLRARSTFTFEAHPFYTIRVRTTDAGGLSLEKIFRITVTNAAEAPTLTVPGGRVAFEDVDKSITGITVSDPDGGTLTVTLSVAHGTLTLGSIPGLHVVGNGTGAVTLSGRAVNLNAALATLLYRGSLNFSGADSLSISVSDSSFTVANRVAITVKSAFQQAADLQAQVNALKNAGVLSNGQANSLLVKLDLKGNNGDIGKVASFIAKVNDLVLQGVLTQAQADALLDLANILLLSVTRR